MKKLLAVLIVLAMTLVPGVNLLARDNVLSAATGTTGRYIITYRHAAQTADINRVKDGILGQNGLIRNQYQNFKMQAVEVTAEQAGQLRQDRNILAVEPDIVVTIAADTIDWGNDRVEAPIAYATGYKGAGIDVGVIDTGIDKDHPDLVNNLKGGVNCISSYRSYDDDNGHGTHCAGTIAADDNGIGVIGVAPDANLYAIKVLNSNGSGYLSDVVEGIDWAVSHDLDIISMSLGASTGTTAMETAVNNAFNHGLLVVAAAGNSGTADLSANTVNFPARYAATIAVAATDSGNVHASFSSTGPAVDVAAPGVSVLSTYYNNQYAYMSGTSMATPHVAGVLAVLKGKYPSLSNTDLRALLEQTAMDLGDAGWDPVYGYGLVTANAALEPVPVTHIDVSSPSEAVVIGANLSMTAVITPVNATLRTVDWSVLPTDGSEGQASVTAAGILTGIQAGPVLVTATAKDGSGVSGSKTIQIQEPTLATGITITSANNTVETNRTIQLTAEVLPAETTNQTVQWNVSSADGTGQATISNTGVLTGVTAGAVTVTAATTDGSNCSDTMAITVTAPVVKATATTVKTSAASYRRGALVPITVTVKEQVSNAAVSGASVKVTIKRGTSTVSTRSLTTNASGEATWNYTTSRFQTTGTYTITAVTAATSIFLTSSGITTFILTN